MLRCFPIHTSESTYIIVLSKTTVIIEATNPVESVMELTDS